MPNNNTSHNPQNVQYKCLLEKKIEDTKGISEIVNRRRTYNLMATRRTYNIMATRRTYNRMVPRQMTKGQTMIYKGLQIQLNYEQRYF